jgi:chromosome segregation ATPase
MSDKVDYLDEDPVISTQKYCVISVLTPKNFVDIDNKSTMYTFKVRGSYETVEEAQKRIQYLNSIDSNVNIYLAEVGKWCPFDDDPEKAKDAVYKDEELNRLMQGYKENQEKGKQLFEQRKAEMVAKALADTKEKKAKIKEQDILEKQKVLDSTSGADTPKIETSLQEKEKEVKDKEEKIKEGKKEVEQKKELIHSKEDKIRKLNDEVNAAKKKYEEMLAKASK